jgi:hypothetical protein
VYVALSIFSDLETAWFKGVSAVRKGGFESVLFIWYAGTDKIR